MQSATATVSTVSSVKRESKVKGSKSYDLA